MQIHVHLFFEGFHVNFFQILLDKLVSELAKSLESNELHFFVTFHLEAE